MIRCLLFLLGLLASSAVAADPLEFCAYMRVGHQELFVLGNPVTGKSSEWLRAGQIFSGYSITSFDAKSESLTVTTEGRALTLFLKSGVNRDPVRENGRAGTLSSQLEMAKDVLKTMRLRYREAHPVMKAQLSQIAELERKVAEQQAKH
jgi:hypothetical protein